MEVATKEAVQPAIRFHGFNGEYRRTRLGECSSFISKGTTPKKFTPEGIRYLRSDCVGDGYVDPGPCLFIDERTHVSELKRSQLQAGDVLFAIAGSIGKVGVVKEEHLPANTNQALAIIRLKDSVSRELIVQMLQSHVVFDYVRLNTSVGAQPNLSLEQVGNLAVSLPTLPEQQKIAAFLGAVDRKIQQLKRKQELLERYKKGVVQQLFSQELRFKRKDGGEFPEWEEKPFGDIYTFYNTNSLSRDKLNYEGGDVLNIHYGDIHTKFSAIFKLENERVPYVNDDVDLSRVPEEQFCQPCDLVIADASEDLNDIGKTIEIASTDGKRIVAGLHTYLARPKKGSMAPGYGAYLMRSEQVREEIERLAHGTKVMSISRTHLNSIVVSLPSLEEQSRIAGFLMSLDAKVAGVAQAVAAAQKWKRGLLQQMFV